MCYQPVYLSAFTYRSSRILYFSGMEPSSRPAPPSRYGKIPDCCCKQKAHYFFNSSNITQWQI